MENKILNIPFVIISDRCQYVVTGKVRTGDGAYSEFRFEISQFVTPDEASIVVQDDIILID